MSAPADQLLVQTIHEIGVAFRQGTCSPLELTTAALERIAATEPKAHAWASVDPDQATAAAAYAGRELGEGIDRGPLHGIPLGVKDIFDVIGTPTRCGSLARYDAAPAVRDARTVAVLREAGAILLGKTVTQEFAAGVISDPARNPWDTNRIPGGSSGGSAVAVALGACAGALGSDTGGSIRIPAAACGVVGFKPAFGQFSTSGVFPLSPSLDTAGPLARTVEDTWLLWRSLLGRPPTNADCRRIVDADVRGLRIGVPRDYFFTWLQPGVRERTIDSIETLRALGVTVVDVEWPLAAAARAAAFIINRVETAFVHESIAINDPQRFRDYGRDLRLRVAAGRAIPATRYLEAVQARAAICDSMDELFAEKRLDALLTPTLPTTALTANDLTIRDTGLEESIGAAWTRLTMPFNATGQPVLAIPGGFADDGMPIGLQLAGTSGKEGALFRLGHALERALDVASLSPPLLESASAMTSTPAIE